MSHNTSRSRSTLNVVQDGMFAEMPPEQLARMQSLDARQIQNQKNKDECMKLVLLGLVILVNSQFLNKENAGCLFNASSYNQSFLYFVLCPELATRLVSLCFWRTSRYLDIRKIVLRILGPVLYACWFIYTTTFYGDFTPNCYEPYPSFGLFTFCVIMVLILPAAFLVLCIVSFLILFCPCISYTLFKTFHDRRERNQLQERVIKNLSKVTFGSVKLDGQQDCAICLGSFESNELVTPLSCDIRHYFHSACIEEWMKR